MTATFGRELIGLAVLDSKGDQLGTIADMMIDLPTGAVHTLVIELDGGIDSSLLPWPSEEGLLLLPANEIERVGAQVILKR